MIQNQEAKKERLIKKRKLTTLKKKFIFKKT